MCYGYHILSKEVLMQTENDNDLYGGQRSSEFKCGKLCDISTIFGQKIRWCKLKMMMMTFMEVKGHQKSNISCAMATIFGQKNCWCKLRMMMMNRRYKQKKLISKISVASDFTFSSYAWLCVIHCFTEVKGHQRSNVANYASKLGRKSSWCKFRMTDLHGGQRPTQVKYSE